MMSTINAAKYVEILNSCLWPGIVGHFTDDNYCFQDDNAPVHRARVTKTLMSKYPSPLYAMQPQIMTLTSFMTFPGVV
jgi:hypothetical protein